MSALLEVDGLSVRQAERRLVRDASFTVASGESVALVGESGSGKSLSAKAVLRLLPPGLEAGGRVSFESDSMLTLHRRQLQAVRAHKIALIPQDPRASINPVRRIGDFLTEGLRQRGEGRTAAERLVSQLLQQIGIVDPEMMMRRFPHEVSGGQLQRVAIAAAMAAGPKLLIADEPTTALDATTQADVMATLTEVRRDRGLAMLFITHNLELAAATCDRIVVMYAGRTVEALPARALEASAAHPYTAALLRARPRVDRDMDRLDTIPGQPIGAADAGPGCSFAPRCPLAIDVCRIEEPPRRQVGASLVACHRAELELAS